MLKYFNFTDSYRSLATASCALQFWFLLYMFLILVFYRKQKAQGVATRHSSGTASCALHTFVLRFFFIDSFLRPLTGGRPAGHSQQNRIICFAHSFFIFVIFLFLQEKEQTTRGAGHSSGITIYASHTSFWFFILCYYFLRTPRGQGTASGNVMCVSHTSLHALVSLIFSYRA